MGAANEEERRTVGKDGERKKAKKRWWKKRVAVGGTRAPQGKEAEGCGKDRGGEKRGEVCKAVEKEKIYDGNWRNKTGEVSGTFWGGRGGIAGSCYRADVIGSVINK